MTQTTNSELPVMESFYTIQGEGHYAGKPAYFIRLGGCDVGCVWCDVKESWDAGAHPKQSIEQIVAGAVESGAQIIVITGGEPLMYNLERLTETLKEYNLQVHLETSGAHPLTGSWDWICLSPKKFKAPLPEILGKAQELKVVVFNRHDFKWAEQFAEQMGADTHLFLQPEWDKQEEVTPWILNYLRENPQWRISLQIHKYLGIP